MPWTENHCTRAAPRSPPPSPPATPEEEALEQEERHHAGATRAERADRPDLPRPLEDRHEGGVQHSGGGDDGEDAVEDPAHEAGDDHSADEGPAHLLPGPGPGGDAVPAEGRRHRRGHGSGRQLSVLLAEDDHAGRVPRVEKLLHRGDVGEAGAPLVGVEAAHLPDAGHGELHPGDPPVRGGAERDHRAAHPHPELLRHPAVQEDPLLPRPEEAPLPQLERGVDGGAGARVEADEQSLHRDISRREEGPDHEPGDPRGEARLLAQDRIDDRPGLRDEAVVVLGRDERDLTALLGRRVLGEDLHVTEGRELGRFHHCLRGGRLPGMAQDHDRDAHDEGGGGQEGAPLLAQQVAEGQGHQKSHGCSTLADGGGPGVREPRRSLDPFGRDGSNSRIGNPA